MKDNSPDRLARAAGLLKRIRRTGWYRKAGIRNCESVADHTFRVALLGVYFAEERGLDSGKVSRMSLIHDLAESEIGDKMPEEKESESAHRVEEHNVMVSLIQSLSPNPRNRLMSDWKELYESKTEEAKLVWQLDKLEMGLQKKEYENQGYDKSKLSEFNIALPKELMNVYKKYEP